MSTPRTGGEPAGTFPAPPGPGAGEMPPAACGSVPRPSPVFPAPGPVPFKPLPVLSPWPMPVPPPAPPRPVLSPPEGDMASEPMPPLVGKPTLEPACVDMTVPAVAPLPPLVGLARFEPASMGAPKPAPLRPSPEPAEFDPPAIDGGGGTTLLAKSVPLRFPAPVAVLPTPPLVDRAGGGGTTLGAPKPCAEDE